jgi:HEAT repeat protein
VRLQAIAATGRLVDPDTLPLLLPFLESARDPAEQAAVAVALGHIGSPIAVPGLRALVIQSKEASVRLAALNAMVQIKSAQPQDFLGRAKDPEEAISGDGLTNSGTLAFDKAADALAAGLVTDRNQITRRMCAIGLGRIGDRSQGPALLDALGDADPGVRRYAAEALVKLSYTPAIPYLLMALEGNIASEHINRCLKLLSNQDFGYDWRDNEVARTDAVERGFRWWTDHATELSK